MLFRTHKRAFAFAPLLAAVALITACDDDPVETEEDPADAVEIMRVTVGGQTIDLPEGGTEGITLPAGEATEVEATFLDAADQVIDSELGEFELRLAAAEGEDSNLVTWERDASNRFAGSLTVDGDVLVDVQLFHIAEGHADLDSFLDVTVE